MNLHYSSLLHLPYILLSDELQASRRDAHGDHAEGLLWFSTNTVMERTALKQAAPAIRFSCNTDVIRPWREVAKAVGFSSGVMRRLEKSGRDMGAIPSQWRAMRGDLPLSRVASIEVLDARGWHGVERAALRVERVRGGAVQLLGPGGLVAVVARKRTPEGYFAYATNKDTCTPDNLVMEALRAVG